MSCFGIMGAVGWWTLSQQGFVHLHHDAGSPESGYRTSDRSEPARKEPSIRLWEDDLFGPSRSAAGWFHAAKPRSPRAEEIRDGI